MAVMAPDRSVLTLDHALDQYQQRYLDAGALALRTRREYRNDLNSVIAFLTEQCRLSSPTQVTRVHLEAYLVHLDGHGYSGAARRRQFASIRSLFLFLLHAGVIATDPTLRLIAPEREDQPPRVLTETEYRQLQLVVSQDVSLSGTRDSAIIELLLQTGLTLSEVARLTTANLDLPLTRAQDGPPGTVQVLRRGRPARALPLNYQACQAMHDYLAVRPPVEDTALFLSKFQAGMSPRSIERAVAKHLTAARIHNASVHTLRHTFATNQVKNHTSLETIQELLGHASLDTVLRYVDLACTVREREGAHP
jgi:integrase/recombinase XerC